MKKIYWLGVAVVGALAVGSLVSWQVTKKYYVGELNHYKLQAQAWEQVAKRMEEDIKSGAKYRVEASLVRERYYQLYFQIQQCFESAKDNGAGCISLLKAEMNKMRGEILGKK